MFEFETLDSFDWKKHFNGRIEAIGRIGEKSSQLKSWVRGQSQQALQLHVYVIMLHLTPQLKGHTMNMKLRLCESEIDRWADRYTEHQGEKYRTKEQHLVDLKSNVQARGYLTKKELHEIARWKSPRRAALTLENTSYFIKKITGKAFTSTDDWTKLITLTQLRGIGEPTASAILHLYDKGQYPILDIHALWSVGLAWETRTAYPFWPEYVHFCRDIASRNDVSMRHLDRALWRFSFDHRNQERAC